MASIFSPCGFSEPGSELPTRRPPPRVRKGSSILQTRLSATDTEVVKKLEELNDLRQGSSKVNKVAYAPLQKKYDDLEGSLNKCKDDLKELQRGAVTKLPQNSRQKYSDLAAQLKKCMVEIMALHEQAKAEETEVLRKRYEALEFVLLKYRKEIEDDLQSCWAVLKRLQVEPPNVPGSDEDEDEDSSDETDTKRGDKAQSSKTNLERNPRNARSKLLFKPPIPPVKDLDSSKDRKETARPKKKTQARVREIEKP